MGKVIFVNRYFYPDHSATSQLLSDLAFALAAQGKHIEVITSGQLYENARAHLPAHEQIGGVSVWRAKTTSFGRERLLGRLVDYVAFYLSATVLMLRRVRKGDVLIVKTDPPLLSLFAGPIASLRGAKLVNWLQDIFPEVARALGVKVLPRALISMLTWLRDKSLHSAWCNVVLGRKMEEYLLGRGVPKEKLQIIHNWSEGESVRPVMRVDNSLRKEWGLENKFVVGYSGNLGRAHEFSTIIDGAALLADEQDVFFLFIGGGAQIDQLKSELRERRVLNVMFKPYQPREKLGESLSAPDLHLISLRPELEGFIVPSKFYGIAAAGRPSLYVGALDGEIPDMLRNGQCGAAVAVGDAAGFAQFVRRLSHNRTECEEMGQRARALFDKCFDKSTAVEQWARLLAAAVS